MKICSVVGARPQFIKAAAVERAFRSRDGVEAVLIHTGQHYDAGMSGVFFEELGIPRPHHDLAVGSASHGAQTGRMLERVEHVLLAESPDCVLVYGDTNSTIAGALAAAKLHLPVAHVEAGLRSFNRRMPEEVNRVLTDHCSTWLLAPTPAAVENLRAEGVPPARIHLVGDVMYDVARHYAGPAAERSDVIERLGLADTAYVLATVHRAENTDDPARLGAIFDGLAEVAADRPVVLPLHPRTRAALAREGRLAGAAETLQIVPPAGYLDMIRLEQAATVIATDSGGVQKEAYFHRVPCVTLRDETEWVELVSEGWAQLCAPDSAEAVANAVRGAVGRSGTDAELYGGGAAAERIAELLTA